MKVWTWIKDRTKYANITEQKTDHAYFSFPITNSFSVICRVGGGMGFPGSLAGKKSTCNARDHGSIPGLGRSAAEGVDYPLQYSGYKDNIVISNKKLIYGMTENIIWIIIHRALTNLCNCTLHFEICIDQILNFPQNMTGTQYQNQRLPVSICTLNMSNNVFIFQYLQASWWIRHFKTKDSVNNDTLLSLFQQYWVMNYHLIEIF